MSDRFRLNYRVLKDEDKDTIEAIKELASDLAEHFEAIGPGRYASLALTALEESVMWAVKEVTK